MHSQYAAVSYNPWVVALSYFIASFASFVALDLAKRVRVQDATVAKVWWLGGSIAMGTGIWSMHFVGMLAVSLPFALGYSYAMTVMSWIFAVAVSGTALYFAAQARLNAVRLAVGSIAMGAGICTMHYAGMASLEVAPGLDWDWTLVSASVLIAVVASAASLIIFFKLRVYTGRPAKYMQIAAALVMAAAICGMHYTGMAAANFMPFSVCLSVDQLNGDGLGVIVTVATAILLSMTLFTSTLDARLSEKTEKLASFLRSANIELQQLAFRDQLTELPNRLLFDERVRSASERALQAGTSFSLMFIDLDGFKPVNDSFGHAVGDQVLREIGRRLARQLNAVDTVARIGGDEFVLLMEGSMDSTALAQRAQAVIDIVNAPLKVHDHEVQLSCSVGISIFPSDGPADQMLAHADSAMYSVKRGGGSNFAFFESHMNAGIKEQIELQRDLRGAVARGELELHYQPKVSAGRGLITGVEALVRWHHPVRGTIGPAVFIPIAERFGLITAMGYWIIDDACRQVALWREDGLRLRVAINLSVHQLRQDDLAHRIESAIHRHRIDPRQLTFEITESLAMENGEGTLEVFQKLSQIGVLLSIDDFGTGYSSLSYLRRLQVGELKIDRSFVQDIEASADARAVVAAVIQLAHALGLKVVAEGVETVEQKDVLLALECDDLQGYFFAMPMDAGKILQWATQNDHPTHTAFAPSMFLEE